MASQILFKLEREISQTCPTSAHIKYEGLSESKLQRQGFLNP